MKHARTSVGNASAVTTDYKQRPLPEWDLYTVAEEILGLEAGAPSFSLLPVTRTRFKTLEIPASSTIQDHGMAKNQALEE